MSLHAKKYYPRRIHRRWEDAVALALVLFVVLIGGALMSATSAHAAEVVFKQTFAFVPSNEELAIQPRSLVVTPDGRRAYVAYPLGHMLARFEIDAAGHWQKQDDEYREAPGNGLATPLQLALSHDQSRLYVLGAPSTLAEFTVSAATGELNFKKLHTSGSGLVGIAISPDDAHVYVTSSGDHSVLVFARQSDGDLAFVNSLQDGIGGVDGLGGADQIVISTDGKSVLVTGNSENSIAAFARDTTTGTLTFLNALFDGVAGVDGLLGAHAVAISDDGTHVYVGGLGDDAIAVFKRDATSGALSFSKVYRNGDLSGAVTISGLGRVTALRLAPHRNHLYAVSEFESTLAVFARNPATGDLAFQEILTDDSGAVDGLLQPLDVVVDAQNHFIYSISTEQKISQFEVTNTAPVANDDAAVATVGATGAIEVLANDTDADAGDHLRVLRVNSTSTTQGAVALVNGAVMYTPTVIATGTGSDSFTYTMADGRGVEASATVTLQVISDNAAPVAVNDAAVVTIGTTSAIDVLRNDTDADSGDTLHVVRVTTTSTKGAVVLENGVVTYTPADGTGGVKDTFTYTIADSRGAEAEATVEVKINTPPQAANDNVTTVANQALTISVLVNDTDPDANHGTFDDLSIAEYETVSQKSGSVAAEVAISTLHFASFTDVKALTYTPPQNFTGTDTFTYRVSDGRGGIATGTVTVIVSNNVGGSTLPPPDGGKGHKNSGGGSGDVLWVSVLTIITLLRLRARRIRRA